MYNNKCYYLVIEQPGGLCHTHTRYFGYIIMIYCKIACKYLEYPNVTSKGANLIRLNNLLHLNFTRSVSKVPFNLVRPNIIQCRAVLFFLTCRNFILTFQQLTISQHLLKKYFFAPLALHFGMIIYYIHNSSLDFL